MGNFDTMTFLIVLSLEAITGLFSNFFIIFSLSGCKRKNIITSNLILIYLCISNVLYTIIMYANVLINLIWQQIAQQIYICRFIDYMTLYIITSSVWLTASLSCFYFAKIVDIRSRVLAWVKKKIGAVVRGMILTAEIVSLCGSFLSLLISTHQPAQQNSSLSAANVTSELKQSSLNFMNIVLILNILPALVAVTATGGSAGYLKLYDQQMKRNMAANVNTNMKDYQRAVHTMVYHIAFYILLILVNLVAGLLAFADNSWEHWISMMILSSFGAVQSAILIHGNPKLQKYLKWIISIFCV
ncbi:taste receptor type 2 member 8-like [Pseudophryne corroboree]|uniref:taste receptor type 2 member 8-like n=1 Tax=Pseudophryne corroboree TaxID=495146 RepID=UPI003081BBB6